MVDTWLTYVKIYRTEYAVAISRIYGWRNFCNIIAGTSTNLAVGRINSSRRWKIIAQRFKDISGIAGI